MFVCFYSIHTSIHLTSLRLRKILSMIGPFILSARLSFVRRRVYRKMIIIAIVSTSAAAQETFLQGNKFFENQQYEKAINSYSQIKNKGFGAYFNLGNAQFKSGNYIDALVAFKRAQKLASYKDYDLINQNLNLTREKLNLQPNSNYIQKFLKLFSWLFLQFIILLLLYLIFLLFYIRLLRVPFFILTLLFLFFGIIYYLKFKYEANNEIIILDFVELKLGPSDNFHALHKLQKGDEAKMIQEKEDWLLINHGKKNGWIKQSSCIRI